MVSPGRPMVRLMKSGLPISGSGARKTMICWRFGCATGFVPGREGNAHVVAEAADDQVIADQHGVFHRAAGNHARLNQDAFNEQKSKNHPEPGNRFAR